VATFATGRQVRENRHCFHRLIKSKEKRKALMKMTKLAMLVLTIAVALFVLIPNLSWAAEDGAALYKTKCAACHGPEGAGKGAIKSLVSDEAKKMSDADMTKFLASNPKHAGVAKSLTPDQVTAILSHVRELQKK
jgi:mono/diheme cytochrome c family protein